MILYIFLLIVTSVYSQQVAVYKERTSGQCGDSGGGWGKITSAAACGAGAAALGWGDTCRYPYRQDNSSSLDALALEI